MKDEFGIDVDPGWGRSGGLIAYDVNGDGERELIFSRPGTIAVHDLEGEALWRLEGTEQQLGGQSERNGLPGLHGSGVQAGDLDADGRPELVYVATDNTLRVLDAETGKAERTVALPEPGGESDRWEHAIVASFRGDAKLDLLLQASVDIRGPDRRYLRDKIVAAFAAERLLEDGETAAPLWRREDYVGPSHGTARVVDLDGDGRDEVAGGTILGPEGGLLLDAGIPDRPVPHIDSIAIGDIDPGRGGLEVVVPEEGGEKRLILFDQRGVLWSRAQVGFTDGDKVQVGRFDPASDSLQIFLRGADSNDMRLFDHEGTRIASYDFDEVREPEGWTDEGIEVIFRIRWTGTREHLAVKERHGEGDVGILDPRTGKFLQVFDHEADRIYVADLIGDWREELVVVEGDRVAIYRNDSENPDPDRRSLWEDPAYRRLKMTWNYYSP